ncbi:enhancer of split mgamma protein-like [Argiope bruennichi]|uniref:enhancer of split mgamma protein-like n=1 Tax=Argiope bruennichi TaxID=94029 RepID=UPI00249515E5|nr:enhancer of split mgamma protein-like [Argiope bruennichi]
MVLPRGSLFRFDKGCQGGRKSNLGTRLVVVEEGRDRYLGGWGYTRPAHGESEELCHWCKVVVIVEVMESNSEYSQGSSQRRRVSKPLIEKRRRARINRSLSQLVEMVAKPNKIQENRTARFEKAYILEMTVEYVKKIKDKRIFPEKPSYDEHENSFQDGYRLCMNEIQNFFVKSPERKPSEELLMKSLLKYLCRKLKVPSTRNHALPDTHDNQIERSHNSAVPWLGYKAIDDDKTILTRTNNGMSMTSDCKSEIPCNDSCSSASQPCTEDEGTYSVSESDSSISDEKVFYDRKIQNEMLNKNLLNQGQTETKMWRPW